MCTGKAIQKAVLERGFGYCCGKILEAVSLVHRSSEAKQGCLFNKGRNYRRVAGWMCPFLLDSSIGVFFCRGACLVGTMPQEKGHIKKTSYRVTKTVLKWTLALK